MSFSGKKTFYHQQIRVKRRNHANFERDDNVPERVCRHFTVDAKGRLNSE